MDASDIRTHKRNSRTYLKIIKEDDLHFTQTDDVWAFEDIDWTMCMIAQRKRLSSSPPPRFYFYIQDMALEEERKKRRILERENHNFIHGTTFHCHLMMK